MLCQKATAKIIFGNNRVFSSGYHTSKFFLKKHEEYASNT